MLILAGGVVVVGGLAWFLWPKSSPQGTAPVAAPLPTKVPVSSPAGEPASAIPASEEAGAPAATPVVMKGAPASPEVMPAPATAPAPVTAPPPVAAIDTGPRAAVLAYEPLPSTPGVSADQATEWAQLVHTYFIEGPPPREARDIKDKLDAIDIVDVTPQFINALIGLNMSDDLDVRNAGLLVRYWHDREGEKMHFFFEMASGHTAQKDIDNRVIAIETWRMQWKRKLDDPQLLTEFRDLVAERLQDRKTKADGQ